VINSELLCEIREGVAHLTINRPQRRNSLSPAIIQELGQRLDEMEPDPAVRVVCLTGAGDKAFCSGADLGGALGEGQAGAEGEPPGPALYAGLLARLSAFEKPLLARVAGPCLAGGLGLMLACDIVIARADVFFSAPEVNVGIFPYMVGALLARNVQWKKAMDMVLTGRRIDAAEAESMGLVSRVAPPESFEQEVEQTLAALAGKSPLGMRLGKRAFHEMRELSLEPALKMLSQALVQAAKTEDAREGMRAFMEKRAPVFRGV
jgi:enoyl-CoA hydratase/carnithine racemase